MDGFVRKREDLEVKTASINDLREAVKDLAKAIGATVVSAFAAIVCVAAEVQTAKLGDLDLNADPAVVTNVTFEGLATPEDIDGKRDKTDLAVYGESVDYNKPYFDASQFPIKVDTGSGEVIIQSASDIKVEKDEDFAWRAFVRKDDGWEDFAVFDARGEFEAGLECQTATGRSPKLSFPSSIKPTADTIATMSAVTNAARSVVNTVWDAKLGVAWEARMHNGALYYIAVTNRPPEVK
jgi:hypothetical protein